MAGTNLSAFFARCTLVGDLLSVAVSGPSTVAACSNLVYRLETRNHGSNAATSVQVELPIPFQTTLVSASGSWTVDSNKLHWNLGDLASGQESILDGPRKSVWWEWTAPITTNVTIAADSAEYSSGVQAYTGTNINQLTRIASHINDFGHNEITFAAISGTKYQISVDGMHFVAGTATGKYRLSGWIHGLESLDLTISQPTGAGLPIEVRGPPGITFAIQCSMNLINWSNIATNTMVGASRNLQIPLEVMPAQFYRAVLLP
jgi:hypothetical protein